MTKKKTKSLSRSSTATRGRAVPGSHAAPAVKVRMYREGLGDCFLLTFRGSQGPIHVLIDCGVLFGTPDAAATMTRVVEDVKAATGGHLHVVIGTHEHWDHLS